MFDLALPTGSHTHRWLYATNNVELLRWYYLNGGKAQILSESQALQLFMLAKTYDEREEDLGRDFLDELDRVIRRIKSFPLASTEVDR